MARVRDDEEVIQNQPRSDAYTGMLVISLGAMITGCVLLYMDYSQYPEAKAPNPPPPVTATAAGGAQAGGGGLPQNPQ
jgi:hypothetical protein